MLNVKYYFDTDIIVFSSRTLSLKYFNKRPKMIWSSVGMKVKNLCASVSLSVIFSINNDDVYKGFQLFY